MGTRVCPWKESKKRTGGDGCECATASCNCPATWIPRARVRLRPVSSEVYLTQAGCVILASSEPDSVGADKPILEASIVGSRRPGFWRTTITYAPLIGSLKGIILRQLRRLRTVSYLDLSESSRSTVKARMHYPVRDRANGEQHVGPRTRLLSVCHSVARLFRSQSRRWRQTPRDISSP